MGCLSIKYPYLDFVFVMNQSGGHYKVRKDALNTKTTNVKWGGKRTRMRKTKVTELRPYQKSLQLNYVQLMHFDEHHMGPWYLNETDRASKRLSRFTGEIRRRNKTKG